MNAAQVGNRIAERRRNLGLTQKQLAEKLNVTDKAVSKWERGLNFPDLTIVQPLAEILGVGAAELLGLVELPPEKVLSRAVELSAEEKKRIKRSLKLRGWTNIFCGLLLGAAQIAASWLFFQEGVWGGWSGVVTTGMMGVTGVVIGNGIGSLREIRKL